MTAESDHRHSEHDRDRRGADDEGGGRRLAAGRRRGKLVGVVTDRDITIRVVAEGKAVETTVGEIASKEVVCVDPQQSLEEAARLMAEHQVRRLPVCEEDGKLVGILAQADVATSGHDSLTGETVQKISQ